MDIISDPVGAPPQPEGGVAPDAVFLLDESGSMQQHRSAVVSTFNEYVQSVRGTAKTVSLYTFDGTGIREKIFKVAPDRVARLTEQDYRPNASTPLYDAMAAVIIKFQYNQRPVQFFAHTDGEENASVEWTKPRLDELIAQQTARGWLFTYLMEGLKGREAMQNFQGLKMAFTPGTRGQAMGMAVSSTQAYAMTNDSNPLTYTADGTDEVDVDAGGKLRTSAGGVSSDATSGGTT